MARDTHNSFLDKDVQPFFEAGDILAHSAFSHQSFICGSDGKEPACNVLCGIPGFDPFLGRSLGEVNGNLLQYSCIENSMDRDTWQDTVYGVPKSQT